MRTNYEATQRNPESPKIEWTEQTWNPVRGCSRVLPGCQNCYAERIAARFSAGQADSACKEAAGMEPGGPFAGFAKRTPSGPRWTGRVELIPEMLEIPLRRRKPTTYFVNSMSDLFHESLTDEAIDRVFDVMALCPQHTFQVLTKRAKRMQGYLGTVRDQLTDLVRERAHNLSRFDDVRKWAALITRGIQPEWSLPLANIWLGVSCEDQQRADERIPLLLQTPAAVRFISAEPLLGPVNLKFNDEYPDPDGCYADARHGIAWVIVGGESGPGARPMHPDWVRSIRDQCQAAAVPFFFKQWGEWRPCELNGATYYWWPGGPMAMTGENCRHINLDEKTRAVRVAKKAAGSLLDGREYREFPEVKHDCENLPQ